MEFLKKYWWVILVIVLAYILFKPYNYTPCPGGTMSNGGPKKGNIMNWIYSFQKCPNVG